MAISDFEDYLRRAIEYAPKLRAAGILQFKLTGFCEFTLAPAEPVDEPALTDPEFVAQLRQTMEFNHPLQDPRTYGRDVGKPQFSRSSTKRDDEPPGE